MISFARQAEVLRVTDEQALEGFMYFARVREEPAAKYPDYVKARRAASETIARLAALEAAVGSAAVTEMLDRAEARAAASNRRV